MKKRKKPESGALTEKQQYIKHRQIIFTVVCLFSFFLRRRRGGRQKRPPRPPWRFSAKNGTIHAIIRPSQVCIGQKGARAMADQLRGDALFSYAVEHYLDTVYRAAFHAAPSPQDAEDVAQEVFEALLRSGKRFREPEHLRAWLLRVTVNKCKNLYRAKRRTEVPLTEAIPAPEAAEPSVLDEVRALPAPYRSALYLHYFEGYTAAEIGRILGAKRNTVLSWLARGRQALRERMIGGFDDA